MNEYIVPGCIKRWNMEMDSSDTSARGQRPLCRLPRSQGPPSSLALKLHTHTHTHTHIYIYIYTFFAAFGGGLGNFAGLLVHFLERGRGAGFSFPGVLLHQSEPVTGTWPVG